MNNKKNVQKVNDKGSYSQLYEKRKLQVVMILSTISVLLIAVLISFTVEQINTSKLWVDKSEMKIDMNEEIPSIVPSIVPSMQDVQVEKSNINDDSSSSEMKVLIPEKVSYCEGNSLGLYTAIGEEKIDVFADTDETSELIIQLQPSCVVSVVDITNIDGITWNRISFYGLEGWIRDDDLAKCGESGLVSLVTGKVYIDTGNENMAYVYEENSTSSEILDTLAYGHEVVIIDSEGNWGKVEYDGIEGWIDLSEISPCIPGFYCVNAGDTGINVRSEADANSDRIGRLKTTSKVQIDEFNNGWGKVYIDGNQGWVMMKYMKMQLLDNN